jgi:hypothetical protein
LIHSLKSYFTLMSLQVGLVICGSDITSCGFSCTRKRCETASNEIAKF